MFKFLKILFFIILIIFILVGVSLYVFISRFDIAKYKMLITQKITTTLNRDVRIDDIKLNFSLSQGVVLGIQGLHIADDPRFSKEDFLTVKDISLGIDAKTFLESRQIHVTNITLDTPTVQIIRNKEGLINAATIGKKKEKASQYISEVPSVIFVTAEIETPPKGLKELTESLLIDAIALKDGVIKYKDESFDEPVNVEFDSVTLFIKDFALKKSCPFTLEASAFHNRKRNIKAKGSITVDSEELSLAITESRISVDLTGISADQLNHSFPMIEQAGLQGKLDGLIEGDLEKLIITAKGLQEMRLDGELKEGKIDIKYMALPFKPVEAIFTLTEENIDLKKLFLGLGDEGRIVCTGTIENYLRQQNYRMDMKMESLDLVEIIDQADQKTQLQGELQGQFNIKGQGMNPKAIKSASGYGSMEINEGKLTNINVLKIILSKISMIPRLVEKVEENLPQKYKDKLKEKDTDIRRLEIEATMANGLLYVDEVEIEADTFLLSGNGRINFDQTLVLDTALAMPKDLTESMVDSVEMLQYIVDDAGRLYMPVKISGKISSPKFFPDLEYLGRKIIVQHGREELGNLLKKVLKVEKDEQEAAPSDQIDSPETSPPEQQKQEEQSPEEKLIDSVLDAIFN